MCDIPNNMQKKVSTQEINVFLEIKTHIFQKIIITYIRNQEVKNQKSMQGFYSIFGFNAHNNY
jgi:hypothetical protein